MKLLLFFLLISNAAVAFSSPVKASIDKLGIGTVSSGKIKVSISPYGLKSVSSNEKNIFNRLIYQQINSHYKQLINSRLNTLGSKPLECSGNTITAEQTIGRNDSRITCSQQVTIVGSVIEITYQVKLDKLDPAIRFSQQRLEFELSRDFPVKYIAVTDTNGKKTELKKFASTLKANQQIILGAASDLKCSLSAQRSDGGKNLMLQLYQASYGRLIKISVRGKKDFTVKLRLDMSGAIKIPAAAAKKINSTPYLTTAELKKLPSGATNLLYNGDFAFGFNKWKTGWFNTPTVPIWQLCGSNKSDTFLKYTGVKLRKIQLISFPLPRGKNSIFTVSANLRGSRDKQKISLGIAGAPIEKQNYSKYVLLKSFNVTKQWKSYTATFKLPENWTMRNICFVAQPGKSGEAFCIDKAKLYPNAPPCSCSKKESFGVEFNSGAIGDILTLGKPAKISISLINLSNTTQKYSLKIDSIDFWSNRSKFADRKCQVAAKSSFNFELPVDTSNRGYFILKYSLSSADGHTKTGQFTYSVISDNSSLNRLKFGMNFHMERPNEAQLKIALPLLAKLGFGSVRAWWDWANVEWFKGKFNWKTTDLQFELCDKYKLEIIPTILRMYGPRWTVPNKFQTPPDDLSLWDNYLTRTVKRYKGRVKYWEIWNEPDISPVLKHKPELYFKLLKRNYEQIKQIDPKAEVIGICGSHMWFFKAAVEANALDYLDIISYHSYYYKYNPEHALLQWDKNFRTMLAEKYPGKKIRLWNTEVGLVGERGGHVVPEENNARAAALLVHNFVSDFSIGVERSFWFTASMRSLNPHSVFDYDYKLTPMLVAMNALSKLLAGSNYAGRVKQPEDNEFFSFLFDLRDKSSLAVIWFNGFPTTREIEFKNPSNTTVMDMMGKMLEPHNGKYRMLSSFPLYLKAKDKKTLISEIKQVKFNSEDKSKNASAKVGKQQKAAPTIGPFSLSKDGMIIDWNLFGPFANPGGRGYDTGLDIDFLKKLGGETNANLNMNSSCRYKWPESMKYYIPNSPGETTIKSKEYHGSSVADYYGDKSYINFINVLKPEKYVVAYAFCYVEAPEDMSVKIKIGSDDGCKIFLNHKEIWRNKAYRKAEIDNDVIKAKFKKGLNPMLIKISQGSGGWGFYLRITSERKSAMEKVKIWL